MKEKIVENILNKFLGDYVTGIDKNNLNLGVWSGDLLIKDCGLN